MRENPLRSPDPAESAGVVGVVPSGQSTEPEAVPTVTTPAVASPPVTPPAAPAAAVTVINGEVNEETLRLRATVSAKDDEIEELKRQVKDREITVCEYQDKLHALTTPRPVPVRKRAPEAKPFRLGRFV